MPMINMHRRLPLLRVFIFIAICCFYAICSNAQQTDRNDIANLKLKLNRWHRARRLQTTDVTTIVADASTGATAGTGTGTGTDPATETSKPTESAATATPAPATEQSGTPAPTNPPTDLPKGPCDGIKSCNDCQQAARVEATGAFTCLWKNGSCQEDQSKETNVESMCDASESEHDEPEGGSGMLVGASILLVVMGGLAWLRCKLMGAASSMSSDYGILNRKRQGKFSETIPLATSTSGNADDDEEWGWEDSTASAGGALEMGPASSRSRDDDDLNMALALDKKSTIPKFAIPPNKKVTPSTRSRPPPSPITYPASTGDASVMPMQITSLGQRASRPTVVTKPKKSSAEDDLFASMGLAATPTFNKPKPAAVTGTSSWKSASMSDAGDADEKWDDDGDLDDLLND